MPKLKEFSLAELAKLTKCELRRGAAQQVIRQVAPLSPPAASGSLIFWLKPQKDASFAADLAATAVMTTAALVDLVESSVPPSCAILVTADADYAFIACLQLFADKPPRTGLISEQALVAASAKLGAKVTIAPGAIIEEEVVIGANSVIGSGAVVGRAAVIGRDSLLDAKVVLYPRVCIGNKVHIHSGCVIGGDGFGYRMRGTGEQKQHVKVPHCGSVVIEDEVELGSGTMVDRGVLGNTLIGAGSRIDNLCHIAHNVVLGKRSILCGATLISGSVTVGDDCMFLGKNGITRSVTIGDRSIVTAGGNVAADVPPDSIVAGPRGEPHMDYFKQLATLRRLARQGGSRKSAQQSLK